MFNKKLFKNYVNEESANKKMGTQTHFSVNQPGNSLLQTSVLTN